MPSEQTVTTEAEALADILKWSAGCPGWQQDALRRLVLSDELSEEDFTELTTFCKGTDEEAELEPLTEEHIRSPVAGLPPVQLVSIGNAQNINALAERQRLGFLPTGVTIVYGDNGSGKSGYVRVLKRACRARGRQAPILRNIYEAASGPQRATLEFTAGGQNQSLQWESGQPTEPLLSAISVFDAATASVHVDATNDIAYTPYTMKLLERLVHACRTVKAKIDAEIEAKNALTPQSISSPSCSGFTEVGQLLAELSARTLPSRVETLAILEDTEKQRLTTLRSDLAQEPKAVAARLRTYRRRLETYAGKLRELRDAASEASASRLRVLAAELETRRQASLVAATSLFENEPLPGVGSETWRSLWEAARAFSLEVAYPEDSFPKTGDGAHCVLCQQPLTSEACNRLSRFEQFVQDRAKTEEKAAREALESFIGELSACRVAMETLLSITALVRVDLGQVEIAAKTRRFTMTALWHLRSILRSGNKPESAVPAFPEQELLALSSDLEKRAAALSSDADSKERKALQRELAELEDRQWLAGIRDDVLLEIQRRKEITALERAAKSTRHADISRKSSELSETLVTDRLRGRFAQEVDALNIAGLALELRKERTTQGVPLFRVCLIHKPDQQAGQILSEGEHRCVALAAFLAELSTTDNNSGIVFDDPISSLDHMHREAIARRLADEGRKRQVIVFTHELPFLFLVEQQCREGRPDVGRTEIAIRHIQKRADTPGYCVDRAPNKAQRASQRVESIGRHLENTSIQFEKDPEGTWLYTAKGILGELRDTWEAAVEEIVSPVLRTFSSKVNTKGFSRLSAVRLEDARNMRTAYGRCSILLHKASEALNPAIPTPDQIRAEIDALKAWIDDLKSRQAQIADI